MNEKDPPTAWVDYSHEVAPMKARWQRNLLICAGTVSLVTGLIGIFLPVLPTTPFLLLSAAAYARASTRFYNWLMNHYVLGPYLRDWRSNKGLRPRTKFTAITLMVVCFGVSAGFVVTSFYLRTLLLSIGAVVAIYILRLPTRH